MGHRFSRHSSIESFSSTDTLNYNQLNTTSTATPTSPFLHQRRRRRFRRFYWKHSTTPNAVSKPPELYRLARYGTLESFMSRLHSHPSEVRIKIDDGSTPTLSTDFPSNSLSSCDNSVSCRYRTLEYGSTPLHILITRRPQPPHHVVKEYLSMHPQSTHCMTLRDGRLPIHIATYSSVTPETIKLLVDIFPESVNVGDYYGWNVFHIAARFGVPTGVLHVLTSLPSSPVSSPTMSASVAFPKMSLLDRALRTRDNDGRTPLHICSDYFAGISAEDFRALLSLAPDVCFIDTKKCAKITTIEELQLHSIITNTPGFSFDVPKRERNGEYTPIEILCREYTSTIIRAKHLIEPIQQQMVAENSNGPYPPFSDDEWKTRWSELLQKLFSEMVELHEFWEKAFYLIRVMYGLIIDESHDVGTTEFSMLHACLTLTPIWCPNILVLFSILVHPEEVSMFRGPQGNLPLHIAASVIASAAAARQLDLDERREGDHQDSKEEGQEGGTTTTGCDGRNIEVTWTPQYLSLDETLHNQYHTLHDSFGYQNSAEEEEMKGTVIDSLLECYPQAASISNGDGYLPFQLIVGSACLEAQKVQEEEELKVEDNETKSDNTVLMKNVKKQHHLSSSPTWTEGVGTILLSYPEALESLDLSDKLYPSILSRFTGGPSCNEKRSNVMDFSTLFVLFRERPDIVYS